MGEFHLLRKSDVVSAAHTVGSRHPLAHPVDRENRGFLKWRAKECACRMRQVMLREKYAVLSYTQFSLQSACDPEFVEHPGDHGFAEHLPRFRVSLQNRRQNPIQLAERLLEENNIVKILPRDTFRFQTELDGILGEIVIVLLAGEALLLGGGN